MLPTVNGDSEKDIAVVIIWLEDGPPDMETYDIKPDAPSAHRGDFKPIRTNGSGIEVCQLLHHYV